jgi:4-hydroxybenzoate polyprenyltransferase
VNETAGVALIVAGGVLALAVAFLLRRRLPGRAVFGLGAAASLAIGTGALLVQSHVSAVEWTVTLVAMSLLGPAHIRIVMGPFGRRRARASPPA